MSPQIVPPLPKPARPIEIFSPDGKRRPRHPHPEVGLLGLTRPSARSLRAMSGSELSRANRTRPTANSPNRFATSSTTEHRAFWPLPPWQCFSVDASPGVYTDAASPDSCRIRAAASKVPAKPTRSYVNRWTSGSWPVFAICQWWQNHPAIFQKCGVTLKSGSGFGTFVSNDCPMSRFCRISGTSCINALRRSIAYSRCEFDIG